MTDDMRLDGMDEAELNRTIRELCESKAEEFRMIGYEQATGPEIWECVSDKYHKKGNAGASCDRQRHPVAEGDELYELYYAEHLSRRKKTIDSADGSGGVPTTGYAPGGSLRGSLFRAEQGFSTN
ncbi:post-transcriptional regulator [Cohnella rhizosphaerae]